MTEKEKQFVAYVKAECAKANIKCLFKKTKSVSYTQGIRCSGYFDAENGILAVATNRTDWLNILVHEYCHLTQYLDNIPLWKKAEKSTHVVDTWLGPEETNYSTATIKRHLSNLRELELDNEKRSVRLIKKWKLNIDLDRYIRGANAYVLFYNWLLISKRWSKPNNTPYKNKNVLAAMSPKFNMKYDRLTPRIRKVFETENI